MARYDRLASLPHPPRDATFAGWRALRDLSDRERDADLARRLRLHFLVLRPVARRVREGDATDAPSFAAQIDRVREELGTLSARDPQRAAIAQNVAALLDSSNDTAANALIALSERAFEWGHLSAAQEYAEVAAELAGARLPLVRARALGAGARAAARAGRRDEATVLAERGVVLAEQTDDLTAWANAVVIAVSVSVEPETQAAALARLQDVDARGGNAHDAEVIAIATEAGARIALRGGSPRAAAELGLRSLEHASSMPARVRIAEVLADALLALGCPDAADHALSLAAAAASGAERHRLTARRARACAEVGNRVGFFALLGELPASGLPALARLELANGALVAGDIENARRHAQAAHQTARASLHRDTARAASRLLEQIERGAGHVVGVRIETARPDPRAHEVAEQLQALGTLEVHA